MALITFDPTGETMNTDLTVASRGVVNQPSTPPQVSLDHRVVSGTLGAQVNDAQRNTIVWKDAGNESTRSTWPMNDDAAVEAALIAIAAAHDTGTSITIQPTGTGS
ncbi:MAG TPA: hypothetical protein PKJ19_04335 [Flavobacteriales bacterium]|nr:hypothetical protein [Flavobacteriales bacterium]